MTNANETTHERVTSERASERFHRGTRSTFGASPGGPRALRALRSTADAGNVLRPRRSARGFTLIEIMAVVLIIGLLGGIVGTVVFAQIDKARVTTAKVQIKALEQALDAYRMDNARYPTTEQGLDALVHKPSGEPQPRRWQQEGYLPGGKVPEDPWGTPYQYQAPGTRNPYAYDLWTLGADSAPGGEGNDTDRGNWPEEEDAS